MGWTSYQATHYKNGKVDRKAECDSYFIEGLNARHFKVLKSSMVGTTYYAAVQPLLKRVGSENGKDIYEDIPEQERQTFAVIFLTSVDNRDYYNFSYKDMDETMGPCQCDCPKGILDLLSPTDYEYAINWRNACHQKIEKKKSPNSLNKLPVGTRIEWRLPYDLQGGGKKGDIKVLVKTFRGARKRPIWSDGYYRYSTKTIGDTYKIIEED